MPSARPTLLCGCTTAAMTAAVATDKTTMPPRNMNAEYSVVRHISTPITASPATPHASSSSGQFGRRTGRRVGHPIASAAPTSSPPARVSVPS